MRADIGCLPGFDRRGRFMVRDKGRSVDKDDNHNTGRDIGANLNHDTGPKNGQAHCLLLFVSVLVSWPETGLTPVGGGWCPSPCCTEHKCWIRTWTGTWFHIVAPDMSWQLYTVGRWGDQFHAAHAAVVSRIRTAASPRVEVMLSLRLFGRLWRLGAGRCPPRADASQPLLC